MGVGTGRNQNRGDVRVGEHRLHRARTRTVLPGERPRRRRVHVDHMRQRQPGMAGDVGRMDLTDPSGAEERDPEHAHPLAQNDIDPLRPIVRTEL